MRNDVNSFYLKNAKLYQDRSFVETTLTVRQGVITEIGGENDEALDTIDAKGCYAIPGFIDPHSHGAYGIDLNHASANELRTLGLKLACHGTTSWLCSIGCDAVTQTEKAIHEAVLAIEEPGKGAELLGIHLEGPFLSPKFHATFEERYIQASDIELLHHYQAIAKGHIRSMTMAPEIRGAKDLMAKAIALGIRISIGHSDATWQQTVDAYKAGAHAVTHLGNAMRGFHHREPGILGAALDYPFFVEIIADGVHSHPAFIRIVDRLKSPNHLMLVSDSMMATGLPDGAYHLGSRDVTVKDGQSRKEDGRLAGSTLTMDRALLNLMEMTQKPLAELIPASSTNAAQWLGLSHKGNIAPGMDADLVFMDKQGALTRVFCRGEEAKG